MKIYKISLVLALTMLSVLSIAQEFFVSGIVTDAKTGETLPGVNVYVEGTTRGTITNIDGMFNLNIEDAKVNLVFSFVGYVDFITAVDNRANIDVSMQTRLSELDEVVVVGYGLQKKKVVTGAIASLNAEEISKVPVLRVEQVLQGTLAGVQMTNQSGQPGEQPTVRIRGIGSTGNSDPLYIVDGMAVGGIEYLNPGDIKSIDVLKDAASAAIYGARAANGVVLITTKSGEAGKLNVTYSGYYGVQNAANKLDVLNAEEYMMLMNEGARNAGRTERFDLNEIPAHNVNWVDVLFQKNVPIANHELSVLGGSEKSKYASSIAYFSQQGIIGAEKSQFDRITGRFNSDHQVTEFFKFGNTLSFSHIARTGIGSNESFNGAYSSALNLDPLTPVYETNTDILNRYPYNLEPVVVDPDGNVFGISENVGAEIVNPLALLEIDNDKTRVDKLVGGIYGELEFMEGLTFKTSGSVDLAYNLWDTYGELFYLNGAQNNTEKTSVAKSIDRYFTWQWENVLNFTKKINNHNLGILLGISARKSSFENLYGTNAKVPLDNPDHVYLNMAVDTVWVATGGANEYALASQFGRITYDYLNKYSFTFNIRRDGSSRFGANNRYGIFPSVGMAWNISDEPFFPQSDVIEFIKLRASYGINGNDNIGNYRYISSIENGARDYIFGDGRMIGATPAYIENKDLRWEESEQTDIALDFGLLNNRLVGTLDYYVKNTNGLLEIIPIPAHVGNNPPYANVGSVQNKGFELSLNWREQNKKLKYAVGINGAYNKNKMTYIGNEEKIIYGASYAVAGIVTRAEEGLPIAYFYGYETDGIFQNNAEVFQHIGITGKPLQPKAKPGDVRFVDTNKDGEINDEDRTIIGNPTPMLTYGLNGNLQYKGFDLSVLIIGSYGNDVFNGTQRRDLEYTNRTINFLDRWTGEGSTNDMPRFTFADNNNNNRVSDLYIEDGSYMRLKNLQLGYNLPSRLLENIMAQKWRVYVSAENIFTLTKYTGADPEIGARSAFDIGIDRGVYPQARTIRFGTSVTF